MSNEENPTSFGKKLSARVFGIGGAGGNIVVTLAARNLQGATLLALNTDAQALAQCQGAEQFLLGSKTTHGLGAGGEPDLARAAAREDTDQLKQYCAGVDLVFVVAGLGGGTGSGAAPVIAKIAKDAGSLVIGIATLPFDFEGSRRQRQAQMALRELNAAADALICLPNEQLFKLIEQNTSVVDTFRVANDLLSEGIVAVWRMLTQTGLKNVDFADLCSITKGRHSQARFAVAEADGDSRAVVVSEKILSHPFLDSNLLKKTEALLVSIVGGADLTMIEVKQVMEKINSQAKNANLVFGAAVDEAYNGKLSVAVIASCCDESHGDESMLDTVAMPREVQPAFTEEPVRTTSRFVPPAPALPEEKKEQLLTRRMRGGRQRRSSPWRQGQLPLELVSRGRFEKSEPTIHQGEDLDVPTYIRRRILLN